MQQALYTWIGGCSAILLCRSSQAVSGILGTLCTAVFRSLQRCLIGLESGLWLGHLRKFIGLSLGHPCIVLALCLGSLSAWRLNLWTSTKSWELWTHFSLRIFQYFTLLSFPLILTSLSVPASEGREASTTMLNCWEGIGKMSDA